MTTENQFLKAYASLFKKGWSARLVYGSSLRLRKEGSVASISYCPLTAVCKELTGHFHESGDFSDAACDLGLEYKIARVIADSADNDGLSRNLILRNQMLKLSGLPEENYSNSEEE